MNCTNTKIFDDYEVDCNECTHYWDSSCDGVPVNIRKDCSSFIATRTYDIPNQIKSLYTSLKSLQGYSLITGIILVSHLLMELICK